MTELKYEPLVVYGTCPTCGAATREINSDVLKKEYTYGKSMTIRELCPSGECVLNGPGITGGDCVCGAEDALWGAKTLAKHTEDTKVERDDNEVTDCQCPYCKWYQDISCGQSECSECGADLSHFIERRSR